MGWYPAGGFVSPWATGVTLLLCFAIMSRERLIFDSRLAVPDATPFRFLVLLSRGRWANHLLQGETCMRVSTRGLMYSVVRRKRAISMSSKQVLVLVTTQCPARSQGSPLESAEANHSSSHP